MRLGAPTSVAPDRSLLHGKVVTVWYCSLHFRVAFQLSSEGHAAAAQQTGSTTGAVQGKVGGKAIALLGDAG